MTLEIKNLSLLQRQAILEAFEADELQNVKTHREARKIAEDIADDDFLAIDEIESRIKESDSYLAKCDEKKFFTPEAAKAGVRDVVGVRLITRYIDKIPLIIERIRKHPHLAFYEDKDYLNPPKPNGYRGFHVIMQTTVENKLEFIEFQVRTMAQHLWASFEHLLRYKNPSLEISEAKDAVFRIISDKLNEIDLMIVKLRDECEPDRVIEEILNNDKILELMTEATMSIASSNSESSQSLPKNIKGVPFATCKKEKRKKKKKKRH